MSWLVIVNLFLLGGWCWATMFRQDAQSRRIDLANERITQLEKQLAHQERIFWELQDKPYDTPGVT